jgi:hypothetical protein
MYMIDPPNTDFYEEAILSASIIISIIIWSESNTPVEGLVVARRKLRVGEGSTRKATSVIVLRDKNDKRKKRLRSTLKPNHSPPTDDWGQRRI